VSEQAEATNRAIAEMFSNPHTAVQFALGSVLTVSVINLVKKGMTEQVMHEVADVGVQYGLAEDVPLREIALHYGLKTEYDAVWIYLLAYGAQKLSAMGVQPTDLHQAIEIHYKSAYQLNQQLGGAAP
jgi:hypothetical protein